MLSKLVTAAALVGMAGSASAATFVFVPGSDALLPNEVVTYDFNNPSADGLVTGSGYQFLTDSSGNGALPAAGDGTRYLSVLGGGTADIAFATPLSEFSLDIGSVDSYNTITLSFGDGTTQSFTGAELVTTPDGNQTEDRTNGRFRFLADAGQTITGISLASGSNSFEVDNIAVASAVPEPATWAMLVAGFGVAGMGLRRRRHAKLQVLA
jgi:hypothetical protein